MDEKASRPRKGHKGKTWCEMCGEQVVFFWKDKPRFCAMCGVPFDWTAEKTPEESLREAIEYADKTESLLVKIETDVAKKILEKIAKKSEEDPEWPGIPGAVE